MTTIPVLISNTVAFSAAPRPAVGYEVVAGIRMPLRTMGVPHSSQPKFRSAIFHIFYLRSDKQMPWIEAGGIVAAMKDGQARGGIEPKPNNCRETVCGYYLAPVVNRPIPEPEPSAAPIPATGLFIESNAIN